MIGHMYKHILFLAISILFFHTLPAQALTAPSPADQLFQKAIKSFSKSFDSTAIYLQKALFLYQEEDNWEGVAICYAGLSSVVGYQGRYVERDSLIQLSFKLAQTKVDPLSEAYSAAMNNYAFSVMGKGDFEAALLYFKKALSSNLAQGNKIIIATNYSNVGMIHRDKGDYDEALEHYKEAYRYHVDTMGYSRHSASLGLRIGDVYRLKRKWEDALHWLDESERVLREVLKKNGESEIVLKSLAELLFYGGEVALEQNDFATVRAKVKEARTLAQKVYVKDQGKADELLGKIYLKQEKYNQALPYFIKAKEKVVEEFKTFNRHPKIAKKIFNIAHVCQLKGQWEKALQQYHEALEMVSYGFAQQAIGTNPPIDSIYAKLQGLEALKGKAESHFELFRLNGSEEHLQQAEATFQLALALIPSIRGEYLNETSKEVLSTKVLPLYEGAIQVAIERYRRSGQQKYLTQAFAYTESNKAILLLESINEISAQKIGGIPDSLLSTEKQLSLDIAYFEKLLNEEKQKANAGDAATRGRLERKLFELRQNYHAFVDHLEQNYPRYFRLKYQTDLTTLAEVQQRLPNPSTMLIEYFVGLDSIYIFAIDQAEVKLHQLARSELLIQNIEQLRQLIGAAPVGMKAREDYQQFGHSAHLLYQQLLSPCLSEKIKTLIIIPDDVLGWLPFEILLREAPSSSDPDYTTDAMAYLLEDIDISYSYSSTLLFNEPERSAKKPTQLFTGFAPSFDNEERSYSARTCSDNQLANLRFSSQEISEIGDLLGGGSLYVGQAAKLNTFREQAPQSRIIHLATHACIDEQDHQFNKIYFADDYLSNNDLYELLFQSQLAVLSACNTGTGQLVKGEGVMSLSRGFIHAGCPSVVMSLWPVDDRSTSNIMVQFYQYMKAGHAKNQALRQAKLDFLSTSRKVEQHPFYWAPFVQFGSVEQVDLSMASGFGKWYLVLIPFIVLLGFILFRR
ncbi:MAG: CHAT domain-containing tetratricopeptide repeat protein [Bacteroidota bacterium]